MAFSIYWASLFNIVSRIPPASPAATMFEYRSENILECFLRASAYVEPDSTSDLIVVRVLPRVLFSTCSERISRPCTKGSPASIMVANCLVKITMSLSFTPPPNVNFVFAAFSVTIVGIILLRFSCAITSSFEFATSSPDSIVPLTVFPDHWNVADISIPSFVLQWLSPAESY